MIKLKTIMVISSSRFLFYDLLGRYQFSDDDENTIIRCATDLSDCVKEITENVTQTDLRNIDDIQFPPQHDKTAYELQIENNRLQAEINRLKGRNMEFFNDLNYIACGFCKTADEAIQHARKALNGESERKSG